MLVTLILSDGIAMQRETHRYSNLHYIDAPGQQGNKCHE